MNDRFIYSQEKVPNHFGKDSLSYSNIVKILKLVGIVKEFKSNVFFMILVCFFSPWLWLALFWPGQITYRTFFIMITVIPTRN